MRGDREMTKKPTKRATAGADGPRSGVRADREKKEPSTKYDTHDEDFDAEHGVLKNKLGILNPKNLESAENAAYVNALDNALQTYESDQRFGSDDVRALHRLFLGDIFAWAGSYRTVDLSSADIHWCHAQHIPREMRRFDRLLRSLTPFSPKLTKDEVVERLGEIHGELIVIHPFRDGNGRVTRLLGNLLLVQAGCSLPDPHAFRDPGLVDEYHAAIGEVWSGADYRRLKRLLGSLIQKA